MPVVPPNRLFAAILAAALSVTPLASGAETVSKINVSYVKSPFNLQLMVTRKLDLLTREFAKDGIEIVWHDITSGAHQTQAMAARSLDIGGVVGSTSVLLANAGGNPVKIAGGVARPSKTYAVVVPATGAKTFRDLKGKTVAGPKGTVLHQLLAAAAVRDGLTLADVNFVSMDLPKASAALAGGHVDGALLAGALVINAEKAGGGVLVTADGLINPTLVIAVREGFAAEHPDLLARYLKVHKAATAFTRDKTAEAIAIGAAEQGLSIEEATKLHEWAGLTDRLTAEDVEALLQDMAFLIDNGLMREAIDPKASFLPVAFE